MKIVLANIDYQSHTTSEGNELQKGLARAGWVLCGRGYAESDQDVPGLMRRHRPEAVFVQDKRDWDPCNAGSFRKDVGFTDLNFLAEMTKPPIRIAVLKDAGTRKAYQESYIREEVGADALVVYYHERSVLEQCPWLKDMKLIRIYHSVDREIVDALDLTKARKRAVLSGAMARSVYPIRKMAHANRHRLGIDWIQHPRHGNTGCHTPRYLAQLAGYRVHVATASVFGFALRKIIESVAVGCTPVTDLPEYDVLPEIDEALVRVPLACTPDELREAIERADKSWELEERLRFSRLALAWYDWRQAGLRLSKAIEALVEPKHGPTKPVMPMARRRRLVHKFSR